MRQENCQECSQLRDEYRAVLVECIKLDGKLQVAKISNDLDAMDRGSDALVEANTRRAELRKRIKDHEKLAHPADVAGYAT